MNDNEGRHAPAATSSITGTDLSAWPRCRDCGSRAPSAEFLDRHRLRRCAGPVGRHVVARRLTATERAEFVRMLRERP